MKYIKGFSAIGLLLVSCFAASAQDFETGYFLGGNPYAFRQNPAFQSERNLISIGLGQTGAGAWSNLGVSTLMYPGANNTAYTFMNDKVPASEFLGKISKNNVVGADAQVNVLTVGFWNWDSFYTIDINVRSLNGVSIPYDTFRFLKEGTASVSSFDMSGIGVRSKSFVEAAFGWSRNYGNEFTLGARVKALVGAEEVDIRMENLKMTLDQDQWSVNAQGTLTASSPFFKIGLDENGRLDPASIGLQDASFEPAGYGAAVDLGFSWNLHPLLTVSGSVLDLGAIRWNRNIRGVTPGTPYTWNPSENDPVDIQDKDAFDRELEEMADSFAGLFSFIPQDGKAAVETLPFRVNLGAEYRMPFYERLSVGALYMGRGGSAFVRHNARVSLNWIPLDWLSFSTGTTLNKLGESVGFAFNLHPNGVNLMVGCDYIPFSVVNIAPLIDDLPDSCRNLTVIPANQLKMNVYVGLNVAFGRSRLDYGKRFR